MKAVHDFVVENEYELKVKSDDFFPYATTSTGLWTGFYTSRPTSKRYERIANNVLQVRMKLELELEFKKILLYLGCKTTYRFS